MIYTDDGWLARKIFVVNTDNRISAKFKYTYMSPFKNEGNGIAKIFAGNGAIAATASLLALAATAAF